MDIFPRIKMYISENKILISEIPQIHLTILFIGLWCGGQSVRFGRRKAFLKTRKEMSIKDIYSQGGGGYPLWTFFG